MELRIHYAQIKDGVSIAYWTLGEGRPLVESRRVIHRAGLGAYFVARK